MIGPIVTTYDVSTATLSEAMVTAVPWIMVPRWWLQSIYGVVLTSLIGQIESRRRMA